MTTVYRCARIPSLAVGLFAGEEVICNYVDCGPCSTRRRANPLPEPTVVSDDDHAERNAFPIENGADKDPDLMRSPR